MPEAIRSFCKAMPGVSSRLIDGGTVISGKRTLLDTPPAPTRLVTLDQPLAHLEHFRGLNEEEEEKKGCRNRTPLSTGCLCIALAGCAAAPQTRQEYISAVASSDSTRAMKDTYVARRSFDQVVATVKQKADECLTFTRTHLMKTGGMTTGAMRSDVHTTVRVVSPGHAELSYQYTLSGMVVGKAPEGGYYHLVVDIDRVTPSSTRLSYYGVKDKDSWEAIRTWSEGRSADCPS